MGPQASVVVTTFNRRERLRKLLHALEKQSCPEFEVVVNVDGSEDGTLEMLASLGPPFHLVVLQGDRSGPAAGRNRALRAAAGDIAVFLDDDVVPDQGLLASHLDIHHRDPDAVVIGAMLPPSDHALEPWLSWEALTLLKNYDLMRRGVYAPTARQFFTANGSVSRAHVLAVGGFDETFTRAEDVELAYRLADRGLHFQFEPRAEVVHDPERSFEQWLKVASDYARFDLIMEERGRDHLAVALKEWPHRHPLNRAVTRMCVDHQRRSRAVLSGGRVVLTYRGPGHARLHAAVCSILWSVRYWQGLADLTGRGRQVWSPLHVSPSP